MSRFLRLPIDDRPIIVNLDNVISISPSNGNENHTYIEFNVSDGETPAYVTVTLPFQEVIDKLPEGYA